MIQGILITIIGMGAVFVILIVTMLLMMALYRTDLFLSLKLSPEPLPSGEENAAQAAAIAATLMAYRKRREKKQ
jgi:Na+-transporting methylmalonyl-CoA/oxaloacetate decarboxylase gamma subunit